MKAIKTLSINSPLIPIPGYYQRTIILMQKCTHFYAIFVKVPESLLMPEDGEKEEFEIPMQSSCNKAV
jgi:hypothetical protein